MDLTKTASDFINKIDTREHVFSKFKVNKSIYIA